MKPIKIVQFGVGPIGARVVKYALKKHGTRIVGAVDIDSNKVGKDLGELTVGNKIGVRITNNIEIYL